MLRVAVFASGEGTIFEAIAAECQEKRIAAEIVVVVTDNPMAPVVQKATKRRLPSIVRDKRFYPTRAQHEASIMEAVQDFQPDLLVLAGYLRLVSPHFVQRYYSTERQLPGIMNTHPSLLPAFKGLDSYRQAYEYGAKITGCTVHFVDEELDHGPIIMQESFPIVDGDTVETVTEKGKALERRLFPFAIDLSARNGLRLDGRTVRVVDGTAP